MGDIMDRIVVFYNRKNIIGKGMSSRTIERDQELPKNCFYTEEEAKASYLENEAIMLNRYNENKPNALATLDSLENDIKSVLSNYNASLDYIIQGDTHGIYDEGFEISVIVNGFEYSKNIEF